MSSIENDMCCQKYAKYAIKYTEYAKYVFLKKICRICTPHFADEWAVTAPGPGRPGAGGRSHVIWILAFSISKVGPSESVRPWPSISKDNFYIELNNRSLRYRKHLRYWRMATSSSASFFADIEGFRYRRYQTSISKPIRRSIFKVTDTSI